LQAMVQNAVTLGMGFGMLENKLFLDFGGSRK
jgi:hypothetical protein